MDIKTDNKTAVKRVTIFDDHYYCPKCDCLVHDSKVTFDLRHDALFGGCGWFVKL